MLCAGAVDRKGRDAPVRVLDGPGRMSVEKHICFEPFVLHMFATLSNTIVFTLLLRSKDVGRFTFPDEFVSSSVWFLDFGVYKLCAGIVDRAHRIAPVQAPSLADHLLPEKHMGFRTCLFCPFANFCVVGPTLLF